MKIPNLKGVLAIKRPVPFLINLLKSHKQVIISIAIILLLGLVSLLWFGGNYLYYGTDFTVPSNRLGMLHQAFSIWDDRSLGSANPRMVAWSVPIGVFLGSSQLLGFSIIAAEKLWFYLLFVFSGLSMFYLVTVVIKNKVRYFVGIVAALFYMFNPYVASSIPAWPYLWLTYASLPLILGLFINGLNRQKGLKYIFLMTLIWWVTSSSQFVNPKYAILAWIPLLFYLCFHVITNRNRSTFIHSLRFTVILFCLFVALNFYWILPTISSFSQVALAPNSLYSALGRNRVIDFTLNSAPLPDAIRLLGLWSFHSGFNGFPYFYWAGQYDTALFIFIGYLIPIISVYSLLASKNKNILFFGLFSVLSILFMNGSLNPFGPINTTIFGRLIPFGLEIFSIPYQIFGMFLALGYAVLFGYGVIQLSKQPLPHLSINSKKIIRPFLIGSLLFLVIGLYAFPLWTGEVAYPGNALLPSSRYSIPSYYYDAANWLSSDQGDFRLFSLPYSVIGYVSYSWAPGGYQGPDPTISLIDKPIVSSSACDDLGSIASKLIVSNSTGGIAEVLALMNVKYVIFHNDVNWQFLEASGGQTVVSAYINTTPENFKSILSPQSGFTLCKSFGQLDFYRNDRWQPSLVYAAHTSVLSMGTTAQLPQIVEMTNLSANSVIALSTQLNSNQIPNLQMNAVITLGQDLSLDVVSNVSSARFVLGVTSQPSFTARYYSGWKTVISTSGVADSGGIVFKSPSDCPYINYFPLNLTNWNALNSTLIYVATSGSPLMISSVIADNAQVSASAWWKTGTSWETNWPIVVPPNQQAVIQVNEPASEITLNTDQGVINLDVIDGLINPLFFSMPELSSSVFIPTAGNYLLAIKSAKEIGSESVLIDNQTFNIQSLLNQTASSYVYIGPISLTAGYHTISVPQETVTIPVYDGLIVPFNWDSVSIGQSYSARYYLDWQNVVRTDGYETSDAISFPTLSQSPYTFLPNFTSWNAYNSTLVYLTTGNTPLHIDKILTDENKVPQVTGIWWETGWMGMSTKPITFPVTIPANQKVIIQINEKVDQVVLETGSLNIDSMLLYSLNNNESFVTVENLFTPNTSNQQQNSLFSYNKISSTQYAVDVIASEPFYLILSQSYNDGWVATINGQQIPDQSHFTANGYANGWFITKTGTYTITLEFTPQKFFNIGAVVSITALMLCVLYLSRNKMHLIYRRYVRKKNMA